MTGEIDRVNNDAEKTIMDIETFQNLFLQSPVMSMALEIQKVKNERFAIIVAHGVIEILTNTLIEYHCKKAKEIISDNRTYPHSSRLLLLFEKGIIDEKGYKSLTEFRKLRNLAAHGGAFKVTQDMIDKFHVKFTDESKTLEAKTIYLCTEIVLQFWSAHAEIFVPYFVIEPIGVLKPRIKKLTPQV